MRPILRHRSVAETFCIANNCVTLIYSLNSVLWPMPTVFGDLATVIETKENAV